MINTQTEDKKVETLLTKAQVNIIDLAHCGTEEIPHKSVVNKVAQQLQKALTEKGFALLVNHGIQEEKLKYAYELLDEFCKLPEDVKEKYLRNGNHNQGYVKPNHEKFGKSGELRHAFNICAFAENGELAIPEDPIPGFQAHMADLAKEFTKLAKFMLQAVAVALNLPHNFFTEKHEHMLSGEDENCTTFRLLYYPPLVEDDGKCELIKGSSTYSYQRCALDRLDIRLDEDDETDNAEELLNQNVTRCGPHCDYGTFTLLAQDSEGGLEVKLPGTEKWQRVGHLPGAILINTGELLSLWTQEKYPALPHRVIIPRQQYIRNRGRHSIAFFCHPDNETNIVPIEPHHTLAYQQQEGSSSSTESIEPTNKNRRKTSLKNAKIKFVNLFQNLQCLSARTKEI
ncbi:uncharacterized protein LOC134833642 isoform X2 [Culicoides brevitarsis]|uniref:uncharacterized protein LOC134833642 isoform X2 n=1 Tax=Culicoides brevitarsis TaxID=469753 RepID=UPI00307C98DE